MNMHTSSASPCASGRALLYSGARLPDLHQGKHGPLRVTPDVRHDPVAHHAGGQRVRTRRHPPYPKLDVP